MTTPRRWPDLAGRLLRKIAPSRLLPELRQRVLRNDARLQALERQLLSVQEALGRIEARQLEARGIDALPGAEFKVWSQWGEDGILWHLLQRVEVPRRFFVEIGVESYDEANTRFLLTHRNWSGLLIDSAREPLQKLLQSQLYWRHDLRVVCERVTRENIDDLLRQHDAAGPIGLLSIDVDGMDYWIWDAIRCADPAVVVVEYNHRFGPFASVTVPYQADFDRRRAHPSLVYYGASLTALCRLADRKGYGLIGCGSAGLNAFFVKRDLLPEGMRALTAHEGFVAGHFREAHDAAGQRLDLRPEQEIELIEGLPLETVEENG